MPEKWTGRLIGRMHNERVTQDDLAKAMGITKSYVSMILRGVRSPKGVRARFESAFESILKERKEGSA